MFFPALSWSLAYCPCIMTSRVPGVIKKLLDKRGRGRCSHAFHTSIIQQGTSTTQLENRVSQVLPSEICVGRYYFVLGIISRIFLYLPFLKFSPFIRFIKYSLSTGMVQALCTFYISRYIIPTCRRYYILDGYK